MEGRSFTAGKEPGFLDLATNPQLANSHVPASRTIDYSGTTPTSSSPVSSRPFLGRPTVNPPTTTTPVLPPLTTSPVVSMPGTTRPTIPLPVSPSEVSGTSSATLIDGPSDPSPMSGGITSPDLTSSANASPQAPVANAGQSQTVSGSTATLNGSGSSDPQDSQLTFTWALVSGPNTPMISSQNSAQTGITGLIPGVYVFKLYVYNAQGLENDTTTSVTVVSPDTSGATVNTGVTTLNTGSAVITTTAPLGSGSAGPYGGGGGGGGGASASKDAPAVPLTMWQKIWGFTKSHWLLLAVVAAGVGYVVLSKNEE